MAFAELGDTDRAWALCSMLNPIRHAMDADGVNRYKVEPYVIAADIYGASPHTGRGGWSWYTGAAGWMYRLLVETLLGVHLEGELLRLNPRLPSDWPSLKLHYRFRDTFYHITVTRGVDAKPRQLLLDGGGQPDGGIHLIDDRQDHTIDLTV